jgi:hypothetical protein
MIVFWLGFSTSVGASAQTAADAAALAAEQSAVDQMTSVQAAGAVTGVPLTFTATQSLACAQAERYAEMNHAHVKYCAPVTGGGALSSVIGGDYQVIVETNQSLPSGSPDQGHAAIARAQASTDPFSQASPAIKTSLSYSCDASVASGPAFSAHGGTSGFFPAASANYSYGCEPRLAAALDQLGQAHKLHLHGDSGYIADSAATTKDPAAVAHACGDASTTAGLESVSDAVLRQYGLVRPFPGHRDVVELAGVSCNQQSTSVDASTSGLIGLGNLNVHLVPYGRGGPAGSFLSFLGGGASSIGETPLQVGCQIFDVWKALNVPRELLLVALMVAQDESAMGQNIGPNRTDPNQSIGVFQQISADGWGTIPEEMNVTTAAEMFFLGAHDGNGAGTRGLITNWQLNPGAPTWALAQATQVSGAGQSSDGAANYGAAPNIQAAQDMLGQVTSGRCPPA